MSMRGAKVFIIVFAVVWVGALSVIGYLMLTSWSAPLFFALIPFGMAIVGLVMFRFAYTSIMDPSAQIRQAIDMQRQFQQAFIEIAGDQLSQTPHHKPDDPYVYQVPVKCPDCNASLSAENVDWCGPLQVRCPYCGATIDAQRKRV